jgi:NADPH-dependent ferric siderophore reductase
VYREDRSDQPRPPQPLDLAVLRAELPPEHWPTSRTYTVRAWDQATSGLTIDFVYHGDEGIAGPWAASAKPGDELWFSGPGGAYAPDESALPAIGAAIEQLPAGARAKVFVEVEVEVEVEDETEEQRFSGSGEVELTWFHRASARGDALVEAVEAMTFAADLPDLAVVPKAVPPTRHRTTNQPAHQSVVPA